MTIDAFDVLHFVRRLKDMGVSDAQAEAGAELARETLMRFSERLATREDLNGVRSALELKIGHLESKFDAKFDEMESKFDAKLNHMESKFDAKFDQMESKLDTQLNHMGTKFDAKFDQMESKLDTKLNHMESKFDIKFGHLGSKFEANLDSLGALLRAEIRVTRVMIGFLSLIVLGTWGVLALPLLSSVRLA